ncbi:MAG TPA: Zn(II)2Cys6 transcription factor domain-containing protein [Myxococcota bacterium]|nr:Zn(II)2Cys6 transcription factor domain-containing protein [Myxococcota bacterium]
MLYNQLFLIIALINFYPVYSNAADMFDHLVNDSAYPNESKCRNPCNNCSSNHRKCDNLPCCENCKARRLVCVRGEQATNPPDVDGPIAKVVACDLCHKKKIKCDGHQPCFQCNCREFNCTYQRQSKINPKPKIATESGVSCTLSQQGTEPAKALHNPTGCSRRVDDPDFISLDSSDDEKKVTGDHEGPVPFDG